VHFGKDETTVPNNKTYLRDTEYQSLTSMRFVDGRAASNRLQELFGVKVFTNPKDEFLLADIMKAVEVNENDFVLDFFLGSGTTAHATFILNSVQNSSCQFIGVQINEDLEKMLTIATGGSKQVVANAISFLTERKRPANIAEISKERIRRAGKKIGDENPLFKGDTGFRVLKIDTSNMADIYYTPDDIEQKKLFDAVNNIKPDRNNPEDLLFQVLLDWGVDLTLPIRKEKILGKNIFFVDDNALVACFDKSVSEDLIKELAGKQPLRVVFRDNGFESDAVKINVDQIFKQLSPFSEVKSI
jgi:adenine-specific DNA-methyltransferase